MSFLPEYPELIPAMRAVLERMARANRPPLYTLTPAHAKAAYEAGADVLEVPRAELPRVEDFHIPARDAHALPARLYAPSRDKDLPLLLYFHGGGFMIGSVATHDILCRELSRLAGCIVVSLDYRRSPTHRFPVAASDAQDALAWLAAHAQTLGADASRLAVGGDSAGGTLAAGCAIHARDAGLPLALQLLFYPGCSAHQDAPSHRRYGRGLVLETPHIDYFFGHYLRTPADREDWRFSPLSAADVEGVAPAWLGLAECDPLVDDGLAYADKLRAAGVPVELEIYRGVTHEFIKMGRMLPEATRAHREAALALRQQFFAA